MRIVLLNGVVMLLNLTAVLGGFPLWFNLIILALTLVTLAITIADLIKIRQQIRSHRSFNLNLDLDIERCKFYCGSSYLRCTVHPSRPNCDGCTDYEPRSILSKDDLSTPSAGR